MRLVPLAIAAAACGSVPLQTPTPEPGGDDWPATGLCVPTATTRDPCVVVMPADGAAIRAAIRAFVDGPMPLGVRERDFAEARRLVGPLRGEGYKLGAFSMRSAPRAGRIDTLLLTGVAVVEDDVEHGVHILVERDAAGAWIVGNLTPF
jgi:hypothetical protein